MAKLAVDIKLTKRDLRILRGLAKGKTYAEIGSDLGLGYETIKTGVVRLRTKIGVKRSVQLAIWAAMNLEGINGSKAHATANR